MSYGLIDYNTLHNIGDAIREKTNSTANYYPREFPTAIRTIVTGGQGFSKPVVPSLSMYVNDNNVFNRGYALDFKIRNEVPDTNNNKELNIIEDFNWPGVSPDNVYFYSYGETNNNYKEYGLLVNNKWSPNDVSIMDMSEFLTYTYNVRNAFSGPYTYSMRNTFYGCGNIINAVCGENVVDMTNAYYSCSNLMNAACGNNVRYFANAYRSCSNVVYGICGPNVTNMYGAYSSCSNLTDVEIGNNVKDITEIAKYSSNLRNIIGNLSSVEVAYSAFQYCVNLVEIPHDMRMLKNADRMFENCQNISINSYMRFMQNAYRITNAYAMFNNCISLNYAEVFENVVNAGEMYKNCNNITHAIVGDKVENAAYMFQICTNLETIEMNGANITDASSMFYHCYKLMNDIYLGPRANRIGGVLRNCDNVKNVFVATESISSSSWDLVNSMARSVYDTNRNIIFEHLNAWNKFMMYNGAGNMLYTNVTYDTPVEVYFNGIAHNTVRCAFNLDYNTYIYCKE
jgi:hypothetical protein